LDHLVLCIVRGSECAPNRLLNVNDDKVALLV
jgi:hypothetical protein